MNEEKLHTILNRYQDLDSQLSDPKINQNSAEVSRIIKEKKRNFYYGGTG